MNHFITLLENVKLYKSNAGFSPHGNIQIYWRKVLLSDIWIFLSLFFPPGIEHRCQESYQISQDRCQHQLKKTKTKQKTNNFLLTRFPVSQSPHENKLTQNSEYFLLNDANVSTIVSIYRNVWTFTGRCRGATEHYSFSAGIIKVPGTLCLSLMSDGQTYLTRCWRRRDLCLCIYWHNDWRVLPHVIIRSYVTVS